MKRKYLLYSLFATAALTLSSCDYNEDHFPGFDELATPTDVRNDTLTLIASNYKEIAEMEANIDLATSKDPEGETYLKALEAVSTNHYFTEMAPAAWYMPAYINQLYPYLDNGSKITIYYDEYENLPDYLNDFNGIKSYSLSSDDYKAVWGNQVTANFLSPSTLRQIPSILSAANPEAKEGDMLLVNYAYSENEPSIGGGSGEEPAEPTWTQLTSIPVRSAGQSWDYVNVGPVDLSEYIGQTINVAFRYTSTLQGGAKWEVKNFKALSVPYLDVYLFAKQADGSFKQLVKSSEFTGAGDYIIASLGTDGNYYPFGRLSGDDRNYGYMYPDPIAVNEGVISAGDDATYYTVTIAATDKGYSIRNAIGKYFYMQGNYDSFNVSNDLGDADGYSWTIETAGGADLFTITNVETGKSVKLNYYVNDDNVASYSFGSYAASKVEDKTYFSNSLLDDEGGFTTYDVNLGGLSYVWSHDDMYGWVSNGYVGGSNHETESFLVSPSIEIGADATLPYFTVDEAFRHGSVDQITMYVVTNYQAASAANALSTRAAVTPNASAVYRFDGSNWSAYSTNDAEIAVLQPADYDQIGYTTIRYPEETLPIYLKQTYPYAKADDVVAVVYTNNDGNIAATEFIYDGATWTQTTVAQRTSIVFLKTDGEWLEAKEYYSSTLLDGESGGFTTQDIALDGLSYVWSLDTRYGWKGSGYSGGNKNTESWLVSPEIDLGKAVAPVLKFDVAVNFLKAKTVDDYFSVNISTDYSGDATKATWDRVSVPEWPEGDSYDFMTIEGIDMSAYVGQKIHLAFHYLSDAETAITVEIQNLSIQE